MHEFIWVAWMKSAWKSQRRTQNQTNRSVLCHEPCQLNQLIARILFCFVLLSGARTQIWTFKQEVLLSCIQILCECADFGLNGTFVLNYTREQNWFRLQLPVKRGNSMAWPMKMHCNYFRYSEQFYKFIWLNINRFKAALIRSNFLSGHKYFHSSIAFN